MKIIGKIFAVLFCIIYFFLFTGLLTISFSLNLLSGNYYSDVLKSVDLKDIKVSDLKEVFQATDFDDNDSIQDVLSSYLEKGGIDKITANAVIENEKIREVVGKFIGDYINYNMGGQKPTISRSDIQKIFDEPDVKNLLDKTSDEININVDKIYDELNNLVDEIVRDGGVNSGNAKRNSEANFITK